MVSRVDLELNSVQVVTTPLDSLSSRIALKYNSNINNDCYKCNVKHLHPECSF